ncbi:MAG: Asp-tRNA(Asn)/Glu-tRNA(Gln) amidotransferase subunit GatA [Acidobacteriota bacterium]
MIEHDSASSIARAVRSGDGSALDIWDATERRLRAVESTIHAFVDLDGGIASARRRAEDLDRRRKRGERLGPLAGVPIAIKDNIAVANQPLGCGSRILDGYVAPSDATAVERLLAADAVLVGKTRLDEFAMGSSCETGRSGPTHNPWRVDRVAGGSSGGSAAVVAAALPLALGSDTGGSVRQPAAFCGVVGLRPTYGRVSRRGLVGFAPSFDQIGPLAISVQDAALAFSILAGPDPRDATSVEHPVPTVDAIAGSDDASLDGLRIGVPRELDLGHLAPAVADDFTRALDRLRHLGAAVVDVRVPDFDAAVACYHLLAAAEASTTLARYDGVRYGARRTGDTLDAMITRTRSRGFGREVQRRILLGTFALSAEHADRYDRRARAVRATLRQHLDRALDTVDLLVTPTAPTAAFRLGERLDDPVALHGSDAFTAPAALAGLPALSVPSGVDDDGMPLGLQWIGRAFDEPTVLRAGRAFEAATAFPRCPLRASDGLFRTPLAQRPAA